jgi:DNA-binding beta-propeller fold protein YncE
MRLITALCMALALAAAPKHITTIAGTGTAGFSGDGGPGTTGQINNPYGLTIGPDGALYFCEVDNHRVRRLDLKTHTLSTVAGSGKQGYSGDGGPALTASLNQPYEVRFDKGGDMFFAEMQNHIVRRVDARTRIISTVAGTGQPGFSGDGGPANRAQLRQPHSIAFASDGSLLICDIGNHRIRRLDLDGGTISTYAGTGERGAITDGAPLASPRPTLKPTPSTGTPFNGPRALTTDPAGNLYVVLREGNAVYRIDAGTDPSVQRVHHIAGTGEQGYSGDGGPARMAKLSGPKGIAYAPDVSLYIADTESHTIRRIDLKTGIIQTVAGTGQRGDGPDGDPLACRLSRPHGIFVAPDGVVYIGDSESHRIRALR